MPLKLENLVSNFQHKKFRFFPTLPTILSPRNALVLHFLFHPEPPHAALGSSPGPWDVFPHLLRARTLPPTHRVTSALSQFTKTYLLYHPLCSVPTLPVPGAPLPQGSPRPLHHLHCIPSLSPHHAVFPHHELPRSGQAFSSRVLRKDCSLSQRGPVTPEFQHPAKPCSWLPIITSFLCLLSFSRLYLPLPSSSSVWLWPKTGDPGRCQLPFFPLS